MEQTKDFGPYELRQRIGKGGMAWVYLAWEKSLDRPVAIKILFPHIAEDERLAARFEREARAAGRMHHENLVQVHAFGHHQGQPYIAMEYVDGCDLKTWLERHGPLPIEIALIVLRNICLGLEHAHTLAQAVIHRDLKPSNVMFSTDGGVKLMDFGLARRVADDLSMTTPGLVMGTVPSCRPSSR
jgi:serine/threonine protein kinase